MAERRTIHPPYFVNRIRGETVPELLRSTLGAFSELHRWLRYMTDSYDNVQSDLLELTEGGAGSVPTVAEMHAKIMIRVSLDF